MIMAVSDWTDKRWHLEWLSGAHWPGHNKKDT